MNESDTITGGCACGALRYATTQPPVFQNHCQCRDCQRRSGTGHGSWLTFGDRARVQLSGAASEWRVAGDSGHVKVHAFCPSCGTPVWLRFEAMPALLSVAAASLDEPARFAPAVLTYRASAQPWDPVDTAALAVFERMPGS